jgi:glucans biosynthesis protein C
MKKRQFFFDNIKSFLTILVILHHAAITYGASGSWYLVEKNQSVLTYVLLTIFVTVNQSYFMGLFFFISGYFTPSAYKKKGAVHFLIDRFKRLGIPLFLYIFFIGPTLLFFLKHQAFDIDLGPLWFVAALLYFSCGYVIWRFFSRHKTTLSTTITFPSHKTILFLALITGIISFVTRLIFPLGTEVIELQLGFFPSYIMLYILGVYSHQYQWIPNISIKKFLPWICLSFLFIVSLPLIMVTGGALNGKGQLFNGGINVQAFTYAMWEPLVAVGLILTILWFFQKKLNYSNYFLEIMSKSAYTAYIIHAPILVTIGWLLLPFKYHPLIKFGITGIIATTLTFLIAHFMTKLPYWKKIA